MVKFNNEKKKNNGNSYVGFGIFKIKLGEWRWRCTSASGFFNFFWWLNQLKSNFIFWNAGVVIFICTLRLGLILEPLKYSENPLESTGESSCPWEIFKYRDLDFFYVKVCKYPWFMASKHQTAMVLPGELWDNICTTTELPALSCSRTKHINAVGNFTF